jgi:hypothetical protein
MSVTLPIRLVIKDQRLARWLTSNPHRPAPTETGMALYRWVATCIAVYGASLLPIYWPIVPDAEQKTR